MGAWQELEKGDLGRGMGGLAIFRNPPGASLHGDVMLVSGLGSFEDPARCWGGCWQAHAVRRGSCEAGGCLEREVGWIGEGGSHEWAKGWWGEVAGAESGRGVSQGDAPGEGRAPFQGSGVFGAIFTQPNLQKTQI